MVRGWYLEVKDYSLDYRDKWKDSILPITYRQKDLFSLLLFFPSDKGREDPSKVNNQGPNT